MVRCTIKTHRKRGGKSTNDDVRWFEFKPNVVQGSSMRCSKSKELARKYAVDMQKQLKGVDREQGGHSTIFKVPSSLQKLEPDAFHPHVVSIGPYHRDDENLNEMQKLKWHVLRFVLRRAGLELEYVLEPMIQSEARIRKCYDKPIKGLATGPLLEMMCLDACFILELLYVYANGWENCGYDVNPWDLFQLRSFLPFIQRDLLMLENQLPLPILHLLFTLVWTPSASDESVADLAVNFFNSVIPGISKTLPKYNRNEPPQWLHLLDIVHASLEPSPSQQAVKQGSETTHSTANDLEEGGNRVSYPPEPEHDSKTRHSSTHDLEDGGNMVSCPPEPERDSEIGHWIRCATSFSFPSLIPHFCVAKCAPDSDGDRVSCPPDIAMHSVTRLRGTGMKFEQSKDSTKFTDIKYDHGKLLIPRLLIDCSTKSIFLNLMAFEQCYHYCGNYITSYVSFMDALINSQIDAEHLIEKRIIAHQLGSEGDVAHLFNNLRKEIFFDTGDSYLSYVSQKMNEHYQQKWRTWNATLKHEYLKDPWKIISLVLAGFIILFTAAQTIYTIVGYHLPRN